ncbi:GH25 family lysozyme [Streptomyces misionensis]|uniref:GH25 family lysozyme n=1 Tax=Streptomyces misionensis TaxID=67331 RepID=UPI00367E04B8
MTIKGIDVSAYQSATYDTTGLDFVFTKITEGLSYINPRWTQQRDRAKKAGLVWGAYHYPHMANNPHAEADYFLSQVKWAPGDIIVLDWEGYDTANRSVPHARMVAYRDAWLKYVKGKMPQHKVGMYCNTDYWRNVDTTSTCGDFLWIATAGLPAGQPGINHAWTFHQYSTANNIDHDVANFPNRAALAAWANPAAPKPPAPKASVSLAHVVAAAKRDPSAPQGHTTYKADVLLVERALQAEHLLAAQYVDGSFGSLTINAYARWQRALGYSGSAADGIPGKTSLTKLGAKHGFTVTT